MKVKDAIILLQRCDPENELVIRDYSRVGIGPLPFKVVGQIGDGIDWDKGKTLIHEEIKTNIRELLTKQE